jgi:hypothetical protein
MQQTASRTHTASILILIHVNTAPLEDRILSLELEQGVCARVPIKQRIIVREDFQHTKVVTCFLSVRQQLLDMTQCCKVIS